MELLVNVECRVGLHGTVENGMTTNRRPSVQVDSLYDSEEIRWKNYVALHAHLCSHMRSSRRIVRVCNIEIDRMFFPIPDVA